MTECGQQSDAMKPISSEWLPTDVIPCQQTIPCREKLHGLWYAQIRITTLPPEFDGKLRNILILNSFVFYVMARF